VNVDVDVDGDVGAYCWFVYMDKYVYVCVYVDVCVYV